MALSSKNANQNYYNATDKPLKIHGIPKYIKARRILSVMSKFFKKVEIISSTDDGYSVFIACQYPRLTKRGLCSVDKMYPLKFDKKTSAMENLTEAEKYEQYIVMWISDIANAYFQSEKLSLNSSPFIKPDDTGKNVYIFMLST